MVELVGSWTQCETADILNSSSSFETKEQVMCDILAGRAPAAIAKRSRSLEKVTTGVQQMGYSFPCSERAFYEFLCRERSRGAPCSRLQSYRQCMAFAVYVMGVDELKPCVLSKRCLGCAVDNSPKEPNQVG